MFASCAAHVAFIVPTSTFYGAYLSRIKSINSINITRRIFHRAAPEGTITIQRRYIPKEDCPQWDRLDHRLPLLHVTSKGTIETEGAGLLQVDFANKYTIFIISY